MRICIHAWSRDVDQWLATCCLQLAVAQGVVGKPFNVSVPDPRLWSPQDPYLYTVFVDLYSHSNSSKQLGVRTLSSRLPCRPSIMHIMLPSSLCHGSCMWANFLLRMYSPAGTLQYITTLLPSA